ncbi:hypothetical protein BOQ62_19655 [Chryseobacterium sp. CH21]|nr:hypothetical protein BOQ62_19655 [Chryseobacterium sp. CH21]
MCRYAEKTYKSHYVCFKCRKSFKQQDAYDIIKRVEKEKVCHEPNRESVRKVGYLFTKTATEELQKNCFRD